MHLQLGKDNGSRIPKPNHWPTECGETGTCRMPLIAHPIILCARVVCHVHLDRIQSSSSYWEKMSLANEARSAHDGHVDLMYVSNNASQDGFCNVGNEQEELVRGEAGMLAGKGGYWVPRTW